MSAAVAATQCRVYSITLSLVLCVPSLDLAQGATRPKQHFQNTIFIQVCAHQSLSHFLIHSSMMLRIKVLFHIPGHLSILWAIPVRTTRVIWYESSSIKSNICRFRRIVKQLASPEANTFHRTLFSTSNLYSVLQVATTTTNIPLGNKYKSGKECDRATMRFHLERNEIAKKMCQMAKVNRWNGCSRCEFRRTFVLLSEI